MPRMMLMMRMQVRVAHASPPNNEPDKGKSE